MLPWRHWWARLGCCGGKVTVLVVWKMIAGGVVPSQAPANGEMSDSHLPVLAPTNFTTKKLPRLTTRRHSIHCRPQHPNQPSARRLPHDALPNDRLPGRAACRPRAARLPVPAPRTRCPSFRLLSVPVRRGQGRQVRQQRLCRPHDDAGPGCKGRHALPAAARPDRGSCQLRFPGTNILSGKKAFKSQLTLWN